MRDSWEPYFRRNVDDDDDDDDGKHSFELSSCF